MSTVAKRRKYRYPDRAAAEEAVQKAEQERHLQTRLARALYMGSIQWLQPAETDWYRIGVFDTTGHLMPKAVLVFCPPTHKQHPHLDVQELDDTSHWNCLRRSALAAHYAEDAQALLRSLDLLDEASRAYWKAVEQRTFGQS